MLSILPKLKSPGPTDSSVLVYWAIFFYASVEFASFAYFQKLYSVFSEPYEQRWLWPGSKWLAMTLGTGMGVAIIHVFPDPLENIHLISFISNGLIFAYVLWGLVFFGIKECCGQKGLDSILPTDEIAIESTKESEVERSHSGQMINGRKRVIETVGLFTIFVAICIGSLLYLVTDWSASREHFIITSDALPKSYDMGAAILDFVIFSGIKVGTCLLTCLVCQHFRYLWERRQKSGGVLLVMLWCYLGLIASIILLGCSFMLWNTPWIDALIALSICEALLSFGSEDLFVAFIGGVNNLSDRSVMSFLDRWLGFLNLGGQLARLLGAIVALLNIQLLGGPFPVIRTPILSALLALCAMISVTIVFQNVLKEFEKVNANPTQVSAKPIIFSRKAIKLL